MTRVLVVDDDFMVARLHSRYVAAVDGFTVAGVAHSGAEALGAAERLRPDLVLLDIYLPDMDGIAVLRELRAAEERDPGREPVDALFITAARDAGVVRAALRAGALH
ncbi:response regulator, partial [Streptomyces sp. BG9H]